MARYSIEDTTLTALGDAVRSQVGETRTVTVPKVISNTWENLAGQSVHKTFDFNTTENIRYKLKFIGEFKEGVKYWYRNKNGETTYCQFDENNEYITDDSGVQGSDLALYVSNSPTGSYTCTIECIGFDSEGNVITEDIEVHNTLTPLQMAEKINNLLPAPPESALKFTGNCMYKFAYSAWDWFIELYGDKITTENLSELNYCFYNSKLKEIPFELNMNPSQNISISRAFSSCVQLESVPKINNLKVNSIEELFNNCNKLKSIPEDFAENWNWSAANSATSGYSYNASKLFYGCYKLRSIPAGFLGQNKYNPVATYSYAFYYNGCSNCYSLEELTNVPVYNKVTWTSNAIVDFVKNCYRLKKLTFATQEDGSPFVVSWKSQVLDLTTTGYCTINGSTSFKNNTGFTDDTKMTTPEDWHGYINGTNPDAWSYNYNRSAFGKTAATELINSLPDASAYLETAGGTNTLKMQGMAAFEVPGEKILELSEEVIAVAAAKGWTVTML